LDGPVLAHNPRFVQLLEAAGERVRVIGGVPLAKKRTRVEEATVASRSFSPR